MSARRPSKPSVRRVSAAFAPARPPPTMTNVLGSDTASSGQGQELVARALVVAQVAVERRGDGARAGLLDPAQRHAQVLCLQDDADALGRQVLVEPAGDLRRQALLDLQGAREQLDHARELGQPDDALPRQVADVGDADERQEVVLAQRVEGDPGRDDELVVAAVVRERGRHERRGRQQLRVHARGPASGRRWARAWVTPGWRPRGPDAYPRSSISAARSSRRSSIPPRTYRYHP